MDEIWKQVSKIHEVSSLGRVRGPRGITNGVLGSRGYMQASIKRKTKNIHVLVAETFIGPRPLGYHVCHLDGDKTNNKLSNLRYDTPKANWEDFRNNPKNTTHAIGRTECPLGHLLLGENLMPSQLSRGWRSCLACSRASAYMRNGKDKELYNHKELADNHYDRITNGNSKSNKLE